MKTVTVIILGVLLVLNLISFFLMRHDKQCAEKNRRRVPEKTLFLSAILFGALGGTLGMIISGIRRSTGISKCSFRCC